MADEPLTLATLAKFHREIVAPDIERVVGGLRLEMNARFDEVFGHFDAIYQRFDRLETDYQMSFIPSRHAAEPPVSGEPHSLHPAACARGPKCPGGGGFVDRTPVL